MPADAIAPEAKPTPPQAVPAPEVFPVTLEEFCRQASSAGAGVEMLAGFHHDEVKAAHFKDDAAAYQARLTAFANRPA